jgi:hypothetical protein
MVSVADSIEAHESALARPDQDDFGSNRSKIMNVIDSNILRSGMRAENRYTLFLQRILCQVESCKKMLSINNLRLF